MRSIGLWGAIAAAASASLSAQTPVCYHHLTPCTSGAGGCVPSSIQLFTLKPQPAESDLSSAFKKPIPCARDNANKPCGLKMSMDTCDGDVGPGDPCECAAGGGACTLRHFKDHHNYEYQPAGPAAPAVESSYIASVLRIAAEQGVSPRVAEWWRELARAKSIRMRATVDVWIGGDLSEHGKEVRGKGTLEYLEQGGSFRIRFDLPENLGLIRIPEIAFDGWAMQVLFADANVLVLSNADSRQVLGPAPNPLFLPFRFADPHDEVLCPGCELRIADFAGAPEPIVVGPATGSATPIGHEGGLKEGVFVRWDLRESMDRVSIRELRDHRVRSEVQIERFARTRDGSARFPKRIRLVRFSEDGRRKIQRFDYRIDDLIVGGQIPAEEFRIPWDGLANILDFDKGTDVH
jgi:hypothetical protein